MKDFKKLRIWQTGMKIVLKTYNLSKKLPKEEKYGLISQLTRAAVSIPSNIAEGSSRSSDKDYKRFLEYALGSTFELETVLISVKNIKILEKSSEIEKLQEKIIEEQKMISSFLNHLKYH